MSEFSFEVSNKLILNSLGKDAVERDSIAIIELIKNSLDAKATVINIDFSNINEEDAYFTISDNGNGMSPREVNENWFKIADSVKENDPHALGGKGVGRFAFFRFANTIKVDTIQNNEQTTFIIDADEIESDSNIDKTKIRISTKSIKRKNGTTIKILNFHSTIDLEEFELSIQNLLLDKSKADINIIYPKSFEETLFLEPKDVLSYVNLDGAIKIENNKVKSVRIIGNYHGEEIILENKITKLQSYLDTIKNPRNLSELSFRITNFYFHSQHSDLSNYDRNYIKKHFLTAYQGVNIYRNNVKIHGHGENDWLKLAEERVSDSNMFDNKMTYGYIVIPPQTENILIEKTDRENFKRNEYSIYLATLTKIIIKYLSSVRNKFASEIIRKDKRLASELPNKFPLNGNNTYTRKQDIENASTEQQDIENASTEQQDIEDVSTEQQDIEDVSTKQQDTENASTEQQDIENASTEQQDIENASTEQQDTENSSTEQQDTENASIEYGIFRRSKINKLDPFSSEVLKLIQDAPYRQLVNELFSLNVNEHTYSVAFLLRSFTEITFTKYLVSNLNKPIIENIFEDFILKEPDMLIKMWNKKQGREVDVSLRTLLTRMKKLYTEYYKADRRSAQQLDDFNTLINDINLVMHWPSKTISSDTLVTNWTNCKNFFETLITDI